MNKLTLVLAAALVSMPSYANVTVENKVGRVLYSGSCAGKYVFSFQESGRLMNTCIGTTEQVSLNDFLRTSQRTNCRPKVRVNQGVIDADVLYASEVKEVFNCRSGDGK